jgi:hypothetical protein
MAYFQTKNPNLGKFWRVLQWKMFVYYLSVWSILRLFGIFCGPLVYFMAIWYIFSRSGVLYNEKSGNPAFCPLQPFSQLNADQDPFFPALPTFS